MKIVEYENIFGHDHFLYERTPFFHSSCLVISPVLISVKVKTPFFSLLRQLPLRMNPSLFLVSTNYPSFESWFHSPSWISCLSLNQYLPLPCFLLFYQPPSQVLPFPQTTLAFPSTLSLLKSPSMTSFNRFSSNLPFPCLFPFANQPV